MLGVAFTREGHEYQDLLSPWDVMHVHRLDLGVFSHPKKVKKGRQISSSSSMFCAVLKPYIPIIVSYWLNLNDSDTLPTWSVWELG